MKDKGHVVLVKDERLLLVCQNKYFIINGKARLGDVIEFDPEKALPMPSYMFAIAAMEEENLEDTLDFIQSKWFK